MLRRAYWSPITRTMQAIPSLLSKTSLASAASCRVGAIKADTYSAPSTPMARPMRRAAQSLAKPRAFSNVSKGTRTPASSSVTGWSLALNDVQIPGVCRPDLLKAKMFGASFSLSEKHEPSGATNSASTKLSADVPYAAEKSDSMPEDIMLPQTSAAASPTLTR